MPRQNKEQAVTNALREEGLKIIASDKATSTEKVHWSKLLFDMQDVTKQELTVQVKQAEDAREAAESALKTAQDALAAANAKVAELEPSALRLAAVEAELAALKSDFDARIAAMREELVAESQSLCWKSQRAENAAKETLKTAQAQFGARGQQILLDEMKKIVEQYSVPEPALESLPSGISPLYLTIFGHSPIKAQLMLSFAKAFPETSQNFTNTLVRCLKAQLPVFEGMVPPDPIEHLQDKIDVLRSLGQKWPGVLEEVNRQVEEAQINRQANFLRNHYAELAAAQHASSLRGEGRTPIAVEEPASITGYTGPHDPDCCCGRPGCNPLPAHLRGDVWLGTRPREKEEDINARHEVDTTLDYGTRLIEREILAKKGKVVTVLPPESLTTHSR
jgi:hypothetical protein